MAGLRQELQNHRLTIRSFALIWAILWATTVATWMYDRAGHSVGMPAAVFFVHLIGLPALAGLMTAGWRLHGAAAGFAVAEANLLLVAAWGGLLALLGKVADNPDMAGWAGVLEFGAFVILMGVVGFVAGWIGRVVGNVLAAHR
jgi:hypothetical protein